MYKTWRRRLWGVCGNEKERRRVGFKDNVTQKGEAKMKDESGRPSADKAAAGGGGTVKLGHTLYVGCLTEGVGSEEGFQRKRKGGGGV